MGYIAHHGMFVTSWARKHVLPAHRKAKELGMLVSEISEDSTNGYCSFAIFPDGSKEGWDESEEGDERRRQFRIWFRERNGYVEAIEFRYGGDEPEMATIVNMMNFVERD